MARTVLGQFSLSSEKDGLLQVKEFVWKHDEAN